METHRLPKIALYGELSTSDGETGALIKRYRDGSKKFSIACHVDHLFLSDMEADRNDWRHSIFKAVYEFVEDRKTRTNTSEEKG